MKKTRIGIIEEQAVRQPSLQSLVQHSDNMEVICSASSGTDLLSQLQTASLANLSYFHAQESPLPHLILFGLDRPCPNELQAIRTIRILYPQIRIISIAVHISVQHTMALLAAGAGGCLLRDDSPQELLHVLRTADSYTGIYVSQRISQLLLQATTTNPITHGQAVSTEEQHQVQQLSSREQQILHLVAEGKTMKQIADELFISPATVNNHKANISGKLNLSGRNQLFKFATTVQHLLKNYN
ncbi:response regulator transcription factor [Hymenobacter sp. BT18]|uniref:response regulator transcription factor n=1 Tax=Hymenobacter sp. BT18 TaxID=2835648 RepID=UPI00143E9BC9|nr:response regulator transcription factor [Hymenobacter sp. BT18]QIX60664.1 response regulator transcription factor [Hymenobacter sp. BT18]